MVSFSVPPLTRLLVSPLILCPWGLGRTEVDVENWVSWDRASCSSLWGTETAPQNAALASARPHMAAERAQRRLVWALKEPGPCRRVGLGTPHTRPLVLLRVQAQLLGLSSEP